MTKQITVEVDENGKINFETNGFVGEECVQNDVVNHVKNSLGKGLGPEFKAGKKYRLWMVVPRSPVPLWSTS